MFHLCARKENYFELNINFAYVGYGTIQFDPNGQLQIVCEEDFIHDVEEYFGNLLGDIHQRYIHIEIDFSTGNGKIKLPINIY